MKYLTGEQWAAALRAYFASHSLSSLLHLSDAGNTAELLIEAGGETPDVALPYVRADG